MRNWKSILRIGFACAVLAGCASDAILGSDTAGLSTGGPGTWLFEDGGYADNCSEYVCQGASGCACVQDRCSGSLEFQSCGPIGATCNVVSSSGFTWERDSTENCADLCGAPSCACIGNRCVGNPEGQTCSSYGSTCNVVSGPNVIELDCE